MRKRLHKRRRTVERDRFIGFEPHGPRYWCRRRRYFGCGQAVPIERFLTTGPWLGFQPKDGAMRP